MYLEISLRVFISLPTSWVQFLAYFSNHFTMISFHASVHAFLTNLYRNKGQKCQFCWWMEMDVLDWMISKPLLLECCATLYSNTSLFLVLAFEEGSKWPSCVWMTWILKELQGLHQVSIAGIRIWDFSHVSTIHFWSTPLFLGSYKLVPIQLYSVNHKFHCTPELLDECLCRSKHTMTPMIFYTKLVKLVSFFETLHFETTSFC